jgi:fibronectin type 3 domain-containing protein
VEDFDVQDNTTNFGTQLDLSWTPVPGATSYNIFRDNASGITIDDLYKTISINGSSPSATCSTSSCVFFDNSVDPGKTYYYRMTAVNDIGFGNIAPAAEKSECVGSCTP